MKNLIYSSSVKRIDASSQREIEMMREAIRGEFEPGKYVRDMGVGALSGAAGGAIVGGGVGSLPAAAVGAIGGAAWGLGSNAASDIWYQTRSDEDKASWQAGDLQEHLEKMGSLLTEKTKSPEIGTYLNQLGTQYKNYIDVIVQKTDNEEQKKMYEQNRFNPNTESYKYFKSQYPKTSNVKFKRVVHAVDTSPAATVGGLGTYAITSKLLYTYLTNPSSISPEITQAIQQQLANNPSVQSMMQEMKAMHTQGKSWHAPDILSNDYKNWHTNYLKKYPGQNPGNVINSDDASAIYNSQKEYAAIAAQRAEADALKHKSLLQPKSLLNATWKGVKGMGASLVVDLAANWGLDKIDMAMTGGEINMFRRELNDVGKIITEINRLTKNQEDVVYAGNMLWTYLKEVDRMLAEVENKKSQEPQVSSVSLSANTPGQTSANTSFPNTTGPIMSSNSSKFKRLG